MMNKISIAIPTYNRPDNLSQLIETLIIQTNSPEEVLIIDASPNEHTKEVVDNFCDRLNIRYIRNEKGLTRQKNRAIQEAKGDAIIFLDDDILLDAKFVEVIKEVLNKYPDIVGVGGYIDNQYGKPINYRKWRIMKMIGLFPGEYIEGRLLPYGITLPISTLHPFEGVRYVDWLPGGTTAWRREIFETYKFSEFFADYGLAEDKEFSLRVSRQRKLALCGDAHMMHLDTISGRPNTFWMGYFHVRNYLYILNTVLPEHSFNNHLQLIYYWFFEAITGIIVGAIRGKYRITIPHGLGILWGIIICNISFWRWHY